MEKFKLQTGWKQNYDIDETLDFCLHTGKEAKGGKIEGDRFMSK